MAINNNNGKKVPNQRVITINKETTNVNKATIKNKENLYTKINISVLDEAAAALQKIGSFKLFMYFAKNQDKYCFNLSSADFMAWSGLGKTAYTSAFQELEEKGFLVKDKNKEDVFYFYEKARIVEAKEKEALPSFKF